MKIALCMAALPCAASTRRGRDEADGKREGSEKPMQEERTHAKNKTKKKIIYLFIYIYIYI
jgi:hypothetical protein